MTVFAVTALAARRWAELVGAATLLTRLPVGRLATPHPPPRQCVWAYPAIGAVVGGAGAATLLAGLAAGLAQPLAAAWALAAATLVTGGLHEDGLADTVDGFGGGRTAERKLAIMRDSRIGSYGALALLFSLALRGTAIAVAAHPAAALVLAGVLGRGAMLPLLLLPPARPDGLAHALGGTRPRAVLAGTAIAALAAIRHPAAALAALAGAAAVAALARRQIGGITGDILGAAEQVAEAAALGALTG